MRFSQPIEMPARKRRNGQPAVSELPAPATRLVTDGDLGRRIVAARLAVRLGPRPIEAIAAEIRAAHAQFDAAGAPIERYEQRFGMPIRDVLARCCSLKANTREDRCVLSTLRISREEALHIEQAVAAARRRLTMLERTFGVTRKVLREAFAAVGAVGGHGGLIERAPPLAVAGLRGQLREQAQQVLAMLTPREQAVLRLRFGIGEPCEYTLEEVGRRFAVSRERIRQIEVKALRKLRYPDRGQRVQGATAGDNGGGAHSSDWSEPPAHNR